MIHGVDLDDALVLIVLVIVQRWNSCYVGLFLAAVIVRLDSNVDRIISSVSELAVDHSVAGTFWYRFYDSEDDVAFRCWQKWWMHCTPLRKNMVERASATSRVSTRPSGDMRRNEKRFTWTFNTRGKALQSVTLQWTVGLCWKLIAHPCLLGPS